MSPCAGCLDDRQCWVCVGTGLIESREAGMAPCHRCFGSGNCPWCQPITIKDVGRAPVFQVPRWLSRRKGGEESA